MKQTATPSGRKDHRPNFPLGVAVLSFFTFKTVQISYIAAHQLFTNTYFVLLLVSFNFLFLEE